MLQSMGSQRIEETVFSPLYILSSFVPVCCSTSSSNCCFLTCIQVSQETGQMIWYTVNILD